MSGVKKVARFRLVVKGRDGRTGEADQDGLEGLGRFQRYFTENSKEIDSWLHTESKIFTENSKKSDPDFTRLHSEGTDHFGLSLELQRAKRHLDGGGTGRRIFEIANDGRMAVRPSLGALDMTSRELLGLLLRRWYFVLLGAAISVLALYLATNRPGVYWTQVDVVLLAPVESHTPTILEKPDFTLCPHGGCGGRGLEWRYTVRW